jgi:hypothetical protein
VLDRDDDAGGGGNGGGDRRSCRLASPAGAPRSAEEEDGAPFLSVPSSSSRGPPPPALSSALASALLAGTAAAAPPLLAPFAAAAAAAAADGGAPVISTGSLDPSGFVPVCPASDGFYRLLQGATEALVGRDAFVEYGPLIAGGLLRVRLELCVVESFANEAVVPFVRQNGLSWILPVHETVETFLAGTIFALAATFILIGSTKIVTIVATYADFLVGFPCRLLGGFSYDRALGKPVTLDVGIGPFKTRLVGPPLEGKAGSETGDGASGNGDDSDWSRVGAGNVLPVAASGTVKLVGIVLGVRRSSSFSRVGAVRSSFSYFLRPRASPFSSQRALCFFSLVSALPAGSLPSVLPRGPGRPRRVRGAVPRVLGVLLHPGQVPALQGHV